MKSTHFGSDLGHQEALLRTMTVSKNTELTLGTSFYQVFNGGALQLG